MSKKYKLIAVDINDLSYSKEFTDVLKMHKWMKSPENKERNMDFMTIQEYNWLKQQPIKKKKVKKTKSYK